MFKVRVLIFSALLPALFVTGACQSAMVMAGLKKAPPPVTDSAYFNGQMEKLLEHLKANKSRNFRRAAILNFVNTNGKVSELGKILTIKFGERAVAGNHFRIVPSGQVKQALETLKIEFKGELTKEQVKLIGDELKADAVVTGKISDLQKGSDVDLTVSAIQPSTGDLVSAAGINIYRSKQVQTLIQQF
ncbi:MAG TPA: hypothetical protein ENI77_12420 [Nitrospirae bacterium]|nr:hypothetical protein [Nitrospirota bacterium]